MVNNTSFDPDKFSDDMEKNGFMSMLESKFEDKPYREENAWWYQLVRATSWLCQVVNVAAGLGKPVAYLAAIFGAGLLGFPAAVAISLFVVIGVEYAARMNSVKLWEKYFLKKRNPTPGRIVAQLALMGVIVALSYFGAPDAVQIMTPTPSKAQVQFEDEAAVHAFYDKQISDAQKVAADYKSTRSWQGRLSDRDSKRYSALQDKAGELRDRMLADVAAVQQRNREKDAAAEADFASAVADKEAKDREHGAVFALIAILSCGLFFLCIYLKEKYEYMSLIEAVQEGKIKHQGVVRTLANAANIARQTVSDDDILAQLLEEFKVKKMNGQPVGK